MNEKIYYIYDLEKPNNNYMILESPNFIHNIPKVTLLIFFKDKNTLKLVLINRVEKKEMK